MGCSVMRRCVLVKQEQEGKKVMGEK